MSFFDRPPLEYSSGPRARRTIIWLHGLGADGHDFAGFREALRGVSAEPLRFIFPHAPMRPVTLNGGAIMPAWFDLYGTTSADPQDGAGIARASAAITELIEQERRRGVASDDVVLGGFSQGGALALHMGLTGPLKLAGVVAWSTYLPLAEAFPHAFRHPGTPIFMAHGTDDTVVPFTFGKRSRDLIEAAGGQAYFKSYPMGHTVNEEQVGDLCGFLSTIFQEAELGARSTSG